MRALAISILAALCLCGAATARRGCSVDTDPWLAVHFIRDVSNDSGSNDTFSLGMLVVSKGGAVTLSRSDKQGCCSSPTGSFVSGRLEQQDLDRLRQAVSKALNASAVDCFVPGFNDPRPGFTTTGGSDFSVYNGGAATVRFNVQHSDPDVPVPQCTADFAALDAEVIALEDKLRQGVSPLQCVPFRPRS